MSESDETELTRRLAACTILLPEDRFSAEVCRHIQHPDIATPGVDGHRYLLWRRADFDIDHVIASGEIVPQSFGERSSCGDISSAILEADERSLRHLHGDCSERAGAEGRDGEHGRSRRGLHDCEK
jgi:hypothetical protein